MTLSRRTPSGDAGVAMLTVVLVGFILSGMGLAVAKTSIANLENAGRDRVSSGSLGVAEAGVAAAITHIRSNGMKHICDTCTTTWNVLSPATLTFTTGTAVVSIAEVEEYAPPAVRTGRYLIRSIGTTGGNTPGKRTIEQAIDVKPFDFPLGVYSQAKINLGGTVTIRQESLFSGSCIESREKLKFLPSEDGEIDPYHGIPAGAHSVTYIQEKTTTCAATIDSVKKSVDLIHSSNNCHSTYYADQDAVGGLFTAGDTCDTKAGPYGDYKEKGSHFDEKTLRETYGFLPRGLSDEQFQLLKAKAKANGTYFPKGTKLVMPPFSAVPGDPGFNPIIYIEDQDLSITTDFNNYKWVPDSSCALNHPSILLVAERGSFKMGSNTDFTGNLFVPDGQVSWGGGARMVGTVFAKELKFVGSGELGLNNCAAKSTHGGLLTISKTKFREIDS